MCVCVRYRFGSKSRRVDASEHRGPSGAGVQAVAALQGDQRRAGANHAGTQVRQPPQIAHHHLQHVLLPPVQMGAQEDVP